VRGEGADVGDGAEVEGVEGGVFFWSRQLLMVVAEPVVGAGGDSDLVGGVLPCNGESALIIYAGGASCYEKCQHLAVPKCLNWRLRAYHRSLSSFQVQGEADG